MPLNTKIFRRGVLKALSVALAVAAACAITPSAWAITYTSGDIFYVAYGSGGGPELVVDIGPSSTYLNATTTINVPQVHAADFSFIIGLSRPNVFVGFWGSNSGERDKILSANGPKDDPALFSSNVLGAIAQTDPFGQQLNLYGSPIVGSPESVSFPSNSNGSYESTLNFVSHGAIGGNLGYNVETRYSDAVGTHIASPVKIRFFSGDRNPFTGLFNRGCVGFFTLNTNGTVSFSPDDDCDLIPNDVDLCNGVNSTDNTDADGDHHAAPCDCNDASATVWSAPSEVPSSTFPTKTSFTWTAPADLGGTLPVLYDVFRGSVGVPASPTPPTYTCFQADTAATSKSEPAVPPVGTSFAYLVRAQNSCGTGSVGTGLSNAGTPTTRVVPSCP